MKNLIINLIAFILKIEAKIVLAKFHPQIIAITGSVAKTSTKEALGEILKLKFNSKIEKSPGNLNNKLGIPLAILGYQRTPALWLWPFVLIGGFFKSIVIFNYPEILVLEIAADKPGEMASITTWLKPKVVVVTAIGPAHLEFFGDIKGVAREKISLVKSVSKDGFIVLNQSDPLVAQMATAARGQVRYFSGLGMEIATKAAIETGKIFKIKTSDSQKVLAKMKSLPGRANIFDGLKQTKIIDDSYNANPLSMANALDFLAHFRGKRKIAVLGDMLELGKYTRQGHKQVGRLAKQKADIFIAIGPYSKQMDAQEWFSNKEQAVKFLLGKIAPGDIILVKASRKMGLEKIVENLREEKWK